MRRFDKIKKVTSANTLLQERVMLNEMLLVEGTVSPFRRTSNSDNIITYSSEINNKNYVIRLSRDSSYSNHYSLSFRQSGGNYSDRTRQDLRHFNDVLTTTDAVVKDAASEYDIDTIEFAGVFDNDLDSNHSGQSLRTKYYIRFFKQRYPSAAVRVRGNNVTIDANMAFPDSPGRAARLNRAEEELKRKLAEFKFQVGAAIADPINNYRNFTFSGEHNKYTISYSTSTELETLGSINFKIEYRNGQFKIFFKLGDEEAIETGWVDVSTNTILEKIKDLVIKYREEHRAPVHREPVDMFSGFEKRFIMLNIFKLYDNFSIENDREVASQLLASLDDVQLYSDSLYIIKFNIDNNYAGKFILAIIKNVDTNEFKVIMERGNERITEEVDNFRDLITYLKSINLEQTF